MPTAPMGQRRVEDQAFPNVRVQAAPTSDTYGGQIGDTVAHASVRMYDLATRSADHAQVMDAERITNDHVLSIQAELQKTYRGKNAAQGTDYAKEEMIAAREEIMGGLANDRQRAMYDGISIQKSQALDRYALQHFQSENEKYQDDIYRSGLSSSINFAKANADDDNMVGMEKGNQANMVAMRSVELGKDPETTVAELEEIHSKTNLEVIQSRLNAGKDIKAKEYYDKMVERETARDVVDEKTGKVTHIPAMTQFTAADRDVVDRAIFEGSTRGAARRVVGTLMAKGGESAEDRKARFTELSAMADKGTISDKTYDIAKDKLEHEFGYLDKLKAQAGDERFTGAVATIDQNWKANPNMPVLDMLPTSDVANMTIQERGTLMNYGKMLRDPGKVVTDLETQVTLYAMKDEDLAKLSTHDMMALALKFDDGDRKSVLTRWNGAINAKDGKKDDKYEKMYTNKDLFDKSIRRSGYFDLETPMSKWSPEKQRLMLKMDKEAALAVGTLKEGSTTEEIMRVQQQVIDANVGEKYKVKKNILTFEKDVAAGSIDDYKDARSIRIPLQDIPVDRQDALKGALRSKGLPLSTQNIEELEAKSRMRKQGVK